MSFSDGFRAHIVSWLSKVGEQATRDEILQLVALEGDRKTTLKNIVRNDKIISKDEILSAPIVFFKLTQDIRTAAINPQLNTMGFYLGRFRLAKLSRVFIRQKGCLSSGRHDTK